ncbi:MAG: Maf family nucleotide pyrophosphatase [Flavobacteriales bacterium]|nr:Maf family nucleotide pyrophosphatase [Flavobacteriales bacterium]
MKAPLSFESKQIILASQSPRRKELFSGLDIPFTVETREIDERFPENLKAGEIALFLAQEKSREFESTLAENQIVITADTIVWVDDHVLNKPNDFGDACRMLMEMSGKDHEVFTGVSILSKSKKVSFVDRTLVSFTELTSEEIEYYIHKFRPFDKAGAYGVQEYIGYIGIHKLEGSYYNVMGLPIHKLYMELKSFL